MLGIEHLHALCVGIVADAEGAGNGVGKFTASKLKFEIEIEVTIINMIPTHMVFSLAFSKLSAT